MINFAFLMAVSVPTVISYSYVPYGRPAVSLGIMNNVLSLIFRVTRTSEPFFRINSTLSKTRSVLSDVISRMKDALSPRVMVILLLSILYMVSSYAVRTQI